MNDHDTDRRLRSWIRSASDASAPADLRRQILEIPAAEPTTQRRRWIRLLPGRKPTAGAAPSHEPTQQPSPSSKTDRGTRTMLSATKMVGLAAVLALLGGLTLALPIGAPETAPDPAVTNTGIGEVTSFTGEIQLLGQDRTGSLEQHDWGYSTDGEQWTFRLTTTDPRYSGVGTGFHNVYEAGPDRTVFRVQMGRLFTANEEGMWLSTGYSYQDPETTRVTYVTDSTGEGAYAGLSAYSVCEQMEHSRDMECHGIVFEGEWPQLPSEAPTEFNAVYGAP